MIILGAILAQNVPILILTLRLYSRMSRLEAQNEILLCRAGIGSISPPNGVALDK